jgi:hypothetical protein
MAIYAPFVNAKITKIERPQDSGPGGDTVTETVIERQIDAIRQPFNAFATAGDRIERTTDTVIANADNTFFFDLDDLHGEIIRIEPGDLVTWESLRQAEGGPYSNTVDEVLRANIWEAPTLDREHVELFTRGQGKLG